MLCLRLLISRPRFFLTPFLGQGLFIYKDIKCIHINSGEKGEFTGRRGKEFLRPRFVYKDHGTHRYQKPRKIPLFGFSVLPPSAQFMGSQNAKNNLKGNLSFTVHILRREHDWPTYTKHIVLDHSPVAVYKLIDSQLVDIKETLPPRQVVRNLFIFRKSSANWCTIGEEVFRLKGVLSQWECTKRLSSIMEHGEVKRDQRMSRLIYTIME